MQYHIDKTHPRVIDVDPICNNYSRYNFYINRWPCHLLKTLHLLFKFGKSLLFKKVQRIRILSLWTRSSDLFPICEIHDMGCCRVIHFKPSSFYILLQRKRDEQIKHLGYERCIFCFHSWKYWLR